MHIALVTETYTPEINGVAKTLARLAQELESRGHRIHLIRPRQRHEPDHFSHPDITHVRGLTIPGYNGLQFGLPAANKLRQLWKSESPDVVYVATEGPLGWAAVQAANHLNIPVLSGFHTNFHIYSKHYHLGWLAPLIFILLKKFHNQTACTLAPSPALVRELRTHGIRNVGLFSRGVDTTEYNPNHRSADLRKSWQVNSSDLVALYVGRIAAEKNIHLVIKTWRRMRQSNEHIKLVIVGDGPLLHKFRKQQPEILFAGARVGEDLAQHYASADIFLFASESETFGNVIIEAMSSGLAVVSFNHGAASMHIQHRHNGMVVPPGDHHGFMEMACKLPNNPELLRKLRHQARITAEQTDWKNIIDLFENQIICQINARRDNKRQPETISTNGSG